eukprot:2116709-Pleurochrysis_carterae.AAC.1
MHLSALGVMHKKATEKSEESRCGAWDAWGVRAELARENARSGACMRRTEGNCEPRLGYNGVSKVP